MIRRPHYTLRMDQVKFAVSAPAADALRTLVFNLQRQLEENGANGFQFKVTQSTMLEFLPWFYRQLANSESQLIRDELARARQEFTPATPPQGRKRLRWSLRTQVVAEAKMRVALNWPKNEEVSVHALREWVAANPHVFEELVKLENPRKNLTPLDLSKREGAPKHTIHQNPGAANASKRTDGDT